MNKKSLAIMCSGSLSLGMGHIMRTLVIAEKLKSKFNVFFVSKSSQDYSYGVLELKKLGYTVFFEEDEFFCDVLIYDSYEATEHSLTAFRQKYSKLIYIDDLNKLNFYDCDILLNRNLGAENLKYNVPDNCKILLGSKYSLLRKEFQETPIIEIKEKVQNIFVTMGGTDPKNTTAKILNLLKNMPFTFNVVVSNGFSEENKAILKKLEEENENIILYFNPQMSSLMALCDIAITACGGTIQEIASLGIPQMAVTVAENQETNMDFGQENELIVFAGKHEELENLDLQGLLFGLANDFNRRKNISKKQICTINKNGVDLVEKEIERLFL